MTLTMLNIINHKIMHICVRKFHILSIHLNLKLQNRLQQIYLIFKLSKPQIKKINITQ